MEDVRDDIEEQEVEERDESGEEETESEEDPSEGEEVTPPAKKQRAPRRTQTCRVCHVKFNVNDVIKEKDGGVICKECQRKAIEAEIAKENAGEESKPEPATSESPYVDTGVLKEIGFKADAIIKKETYDKGSATIVLEMKDTRELRLAMMDLKKGIVIAHLYNPQLTVTGPILESMVPVGAKVAPITTKGPESSQEENQEPEVEFVNPGEESEDEELYPEGPEPDGPPPADENSSEEEIPWDN